jgi:hypothetical protein
MSIENRIVTFGSRPGTGQGAAHFNRPQIWPIPNSAQSRSGSPAQHAMFQGAAYRLTLERRMLSRDTEKI